MKLPMKWLKEYTEINLPAQEYAEKMVMAGNGVEGVENTGDLFDKVVVGHVLSCEDIEGTHLHLCMVDVGQAEPLQIVCGAPNVKAGAWVCAALDGARLPGGVKIKKGKLRGYVSNGMLCSGPELDVPAGLYPHCGEEGIILLNEEYAPGTDVKEVFHLGDDVIDFEVLANRPDCLSVWGLARESAAVLDTHCVMPEIAVEEAEGVDAFDDYAKIAVEDDELCPRYCARVIKNVKIGPSPMWMREYLYGAGVRPINNIVDITNFVMLETGHPMHAFDLSRVRGRRIVVRRAHEGEPLTTLDGKEYTLTENMLVIADAERATGLAGIMGGEESEIVESTTDVLFECAAFDRTNNRLTSRALGIRTESSGRFEKGVCVRTTMEALDRACMLVNMLECGDVVPGAFDHYPNPLNPQVIDADVNRINRRISCRLSASEMEDILERLGFEVEVSGDELSCTVPEWRMDLETDADISEEVLRLYGYDKIPSTLMTGVTMAGHRSEKQALLDIVKNSLVSMGYFEALNFSFISPKWIAALNLPEDDPRRRFVTIRNPLGEDTSVMRTTLVPSMLNTLALNINRGNAEGRLFEAAPVFSEGKTDTTAATEKPSLCLGLYGEKADFYALRDAVVCLLGQFGIKPAVSAGGDGYYHPGRKAVLTVGETVIARVGEIHPDVAGAFDIDGRVYVAEVDLSLVPALARPIPAVQPLPRFPAVTRDIALVMGEAVEVGPVMDAIVRAGGRLIEEVRLFDIYRGEKLGQDKKSVAFALSFRAADRTLTDAEIAAAMDKILAACRDGFGAELRS
ncbi:MAG: phenylalanine--tRNA ligase subunit beta [Clostridia bacterium]|nr:phenylalanine--tRNA ligase subunit beta [Clostridia bacterium]